MAVKRCAVCNVRMSKGHKKGPKPITCSRSSCKKDWALQHRTLDRTFQLSAIRSMELELYRLYPDAWDDN